MKIRAMGIKRQIKNYIYIKKHYPLSERTTIDPLKKNILIIDNQIPTFDKDSGSNRITEIAKFLAKDFNVFLMGWQKPIPKSDERKYIQNFNRHNVTVYTPFINGYGIVRGKKYFLDQLIPDLDFVWCHRPDAFEHYLSFFRKKAPKAKIIYDMVDIHFLRMERGLALDYDEKLAAEIEHYKYIETQLSSKADKVVVISDKEKKLMTDFVDESKLFTISNVHNLKIKSEEVPEYEERNHLFFVGSFYHLPNVDAVTFLHEKIMPLVWQSLPNLKVYIIGQEPPEEILKMNSDLFQIKGFVEDLTPYYENCIASISPLRYGAGVKGKIGQAFEYMLPVVTTTIGAEGMFLNNKETALISGNDDHQAFAHNIIELCTNASVWSTLHRNSEKAIFPFTIEFQKDELFRLLS
ncbi:glycosyltransferase [Kaistella soli]|uniref:glycosyltransferase n=1 Tax=Kaistella soli TaxID=2849654 RepID=UPI001FE4F3EF|nr:glycosyltransferase [Kaistella soli]